MASYEPRATIVFEAGVASTEPGDQRQAFLQLFEFSPRFEYTAGHEVHQAGDLAVHLAPWRMTGRAPDGASITDQGLSVAVLRKQPDGRWLLVLDAPHGEHLMKL